MYFLADKEHTISTAQALQTFSILKKKNLWLAKPCLSSHKGMINRRGYESPHRLNFFMEIIHFPSIPIVFVECDTPWSLQAVICSFCSHALLDFSLFHLFPDGQEIHLLQSQQNLACGVAVTKRLSQDLHFKIKIYLLSF